MKSLVGVVRSCAALCVRLAVQDAGSVESRRRLGLALLAAIGLLIAAIRFYPDAVELTSPDACADPLRRPAVVTIGSALKLGGC